MPSGLPSAWDRRAHTGVSPADTRAPGPGLAVGPQRVSATPMVTVPTTPRALARVPKQWGTLLNVLPSIRALELEGTAQLWRYAGPPPEKETAQPRALAGGATVTGCGGDSGAEEWRAF